MAIELRFRAPARELARSVPPGALHGEGDLDELHQLEAFREKVAPLLSRR